MKKFGIFISTLIGAVLLMGTGGTTVGSGGDYIRQLFLDSKVAVATKVERLLPCSYDAQTESWVVNWLNVNQAALAADIRNSNHLWVVDAQSTCGFTAHSPRSDIYLSYPTCSNTARTAEQAMYVLVHESAHHLGIADEREADKIATAIMNGTILANCPGAGTIVDPAICNSQPMTTADAAKYFRPGQNSVEVPIQLETYGQHRTCSTISGCSAWTKWDVDFEIGVYSATYPLKAFLQIRATPQTPFFTARLAFDKVYRAYSFPINGDFQLTNSEGNYLYFGGPGLSKQNSYYSFKGWGGKDCFWAKAPVTITNSAGTRDEYEVYFHGRF